MAVKKDPYKRIALLPETKDRFEEWSWTLKEKTHDGILNAMMDILDSINRDQLEEYIAQRAKVEVPA